MTLGERTRRVLASIFLPMIQVRQIRPLHEGDPDQARKERPLPTTAQTKWLQSDIADAIRLADSGNLQKAARLARAMRRDGTMSGLLSTRAGGLTRLPKIYRGTPDVVAELDRHDDIGLFDRIFPAKELELLDADGILLGVGVGELVPQPCSDEPIFVRLDPEFLRYVWAEDCWYYATVDGLTPVTPGDGRWILHTPGGYQQPWTNGLWPSLGRAYIAKEHAFLYRENYSGKLANPARIAINPQGADTKESDGFFRKVLAWGLNPAFRLPPGWDVKLLESNGRGYDVFTQTIDSSDKEFMIGVSGQVVTATGGTGFANADIHATIRSDLIQGDGFGLAATINPQGLRPTVARLFGAGARGLVAWDTRPPADLNAEASAISAASNAIDDANRALAPYGLRVDAQEMLTRFKIPAYSIQSTDEDLEGLRSSPSATDAPPTQDAAASLAAKMSEHGVARCEHGSANRCRLCGVERVRDFVTGPDGSPQWQVAWRPIVTVQQQLAPVSAMARPLLQEGAA